MPHPSLRPQGSRVSSWLLWTSLPCIPFVDGPLVHRGVLVLADATSVQLMCCALEVEAGAHGADVESGPGTFQDELEAQQLDPEDLVTAQSLSTQGYVLEVHMPSVLDGGGAASQVL